MSSQPQGAIIPRHLRSDKPSGGLAQFPIGEEAPTTRYIVIGGSNSVLKGGWVSKLAARLPPDLVVNLSLGASPSMMGYFRLLEFTSAQAGDTVLWEYAVNDEEFIQNGAAGIDDVLNFVARTLALCAERGLSFSAIILRSQDKLAENPPSDYRRRLMDLFDGAKVRYFDMDQRLRAAGAVTTPEGIAALYRDRRHLKTAGTVTTEVAAWAMARDTARPPPARQEGFDPLPRIAMADQFLGSHATARLSNRLVNFSALHPILPDGEMRLDCPKGGRFNLVGFVLMRTLVSGSLICRNSTARIEVNLRHPRVVFGKPLIVFLPARKSTGPRMVISEEDPPQFQWKELPDQQRGGDELGGIVSVMLEAL